MKISPNTNCALLIPSPGVLLLVFQAEANQPTTVLLKKSDKTIRSRMCLIQSWPQSPAAVKSERDLLGRLIVCRVAGTGRYCVEFNTLV